MSNEKHLIDVGGIDVEVVRKKVKNVNLRVYPPDGRVRVAVPRTMSDTAVRLAILHRVPWIRRHQARLKDQPRQFRLEMVSGESHYFLGQRYCLNVVEHDGRLNWRCATSPS